MSKVELARIAVEVALLASLNEPADPLETVKKRAEEVTGCECETSYSADGESINILVKPLERVYITVKVE